MLSFSAADLLLRLRDAGAPYVAMNRIMSDYRTHPADFRDRPRPDGPALKRLIEEIREIAGADNVLDHPDRLKVYDCDGYVIERSLPDAVVFPETTEQTALCVRACNRAGVGYVPRGAGTSLAGGTLAVGGGLVICTSRMKRILDIDVENRCATVQAGVVNMWLTNELNARESGLHYAPDPSSQTACTIGGNVGTNSGGPHTLKYGVTVNHVLGVTMVLPDGEIATLGGAIEDEPNLDLVGLFVGNEGTLGICTEAVLRLTRNPEGGRTFLASFDLAENCARAISGIISQGIVPAALEMLDNIVINAVEDKAKLGLPREANALLLIELDGILAGMDPEAEAVKQVVAEHGGVLRTEIPFRTRKEPDYAAIWKARKTAFGAIGRVCPTYFTQDGVVPRTKLPEILRFMDDVSKRHRLRIANVFHAGDGNIHPLILFDDADPTQLGRAMDASTEILDKCIEMGGSVTGEHGIGVEKLDFMPRLFRMESLEAMAAVRDAINPAGICSPCKLLPIGCGCVERTKLPSGGGF